MDGTNLICFDLCHSFDALVLLPKKKTKEKETNCGESRVNSHLLELVRILNRPPSMRNIDVRSKLNPNRRLRIKIKRYSMTQISFQG